MNGKGEHTGGGVFLIGLALLFLTGWWWPGILFVIGASMLVRGISEGLSWNEMSGALIVIGLGLVFWFGFRINWGLLVPLFLIGIGLVMIFGGGERLNEWNKHKRKNDQSA